MCPSDNTGPASFGFDVNPQVEDDLLAEVDDVLEENAEDFVRAYVQREGNGGYQYVALVDGLIDMFGEQIVYGIIEFLEHNRPYGVGIRYGVDMQHSVAQRFGEDVAAYLGSYLDESHFIEIARATLEPLEDYNTRPPTASPTADKAEQLGRAALAHGMFSVARDNFEQSVTADPDRQEIVRREYGFLFDQVVAHDIEWLSGMWVALSAKSPTPLSRLRPERVVNLLDAEVESEEHKESFTVVEAIKLNEEPTSHATSPSPQQRGEDLENAFIATLSSLFDIGDSERKRIVTRLRRQKSGSQYGHDVEFDTTSSGHVDVRCHVECKNYSRLITLGDIADKLLQTDFHWRGVRLDHWILVSPHSDASNELSLMLQSWNEQEKFPFQIHVCSPETGVRQILATEPSVFSTIYGQEPQYEGDDVELCLRAWREQLRAVIRLPPEIRTYLDSDHDHCLAGEDSAHFAHLLTDSITLHATDDKGAPLKRTLDEEVHTWVEDRSQSRCLLLLGEFGDGKSFFTYKLSRTLAQRFLASPTSSPLCLRLSLRELRHVENAQELLERRLRQLGVSISQWLTAAHDHGSVIILDGFDEMSSQLDSATLSRNISYLADCYQFFSDSKILLTSRTHYFDSRRDQERLFDRLGRPRVLRLSPVPRVRRVNNLLGYAKERGLEERMVALRKLYDPIGLSAKPLFLQMIKETLPELPEDHFDEVVLYETYINQSLRRKIADLHHESAQVVDEELVLALRSVLCSIATELQISGLDYVCLRDFQVAQELANVLWRISDISTDASEPAESDARRRIGIRSLLKPSLGVDGDLWPVEFFHRSMREYFVAEAIVEKLAEDPYSAVQLLAARPLAPEIIGFAVKLFQGSADVEKFRAGLLSLARGAVVDRENGCTGGNALTLLYRSSNSVPGDAWSGLQLDFANLTGADLSKKNLSCTTLRNAVLDNCILTDTDLRFSDLTGVRLEETASVVSLHGVGEDRVYAGYGDGSIREWQLAPPKAPTYTTCAENLSGRPTVIGSRSGSVLVLHGKYASVFGVNKSGSWSRIAHFRVRNEVARVQVLQEDQVLITYERHRNGPPMLARYDPEARTVLTSSALASFGPCCLLDADFAVVPIGLYTVSVGKTVIDEVSVVCSIQISPGECLLAVGHTQGDVALYAVSLSSGFRMRSLWRQTLHDGLITDIVFLSNFTLVTGGKDRKVCVLEVSDNEAAVVSTLNMTLMCGGVQTEGVQREVERLRLEELSAGTGRSV